MYDANGNFYNYWSDGTIRNMEEGSVGSENATEIYRDYVYESDIRENSKTAKYWHKNGQLSTESLFKNGGFYNAKSWHNNGQLWKKIHYENNLKNFTKY
jgi:antitoxin component YwqK of YwqJK toxin-antitoxin module